MGNGSEMVEGRAAAVARKRAIDERVNAELEELDRGFFVADLDNFTGSAEKTLEKMQELVESLVETIPRLDIEILRRDEDNFCEAVSLVEKKKTEFEILRTKFKVQVESQYPKVPLSQKLVILLLGLFHGQVRESVILQTFGGNKRKRESFFGAARELACIIDEISHGAVYAKEFRAREELDKIEIRAKEILAKDKDYQGLIAKLDNTFRLGGYSVSFVQDLKRKKKRAEEDALVKARAEHLLI